MANKLQNDEEIVLIDDIDKKILNHLVDNARTRLVILARNEGLSIDVKRNGLQSLRRKE